MKFINLFKNKLKKSCCFTKLRSFFCENILNPFDEKINYKILKNKFEYIHKYKLSLKNPESFNEKIIWSKLFNRDELITKTQDKYLVRNFVKNKLGKKYANEILIPLLVHSKDPSEIDFDILPENYIIKPNNAAGRFFIVRNNKINQNKAMKVCKKWLKMPYGICAREWSYKNIEPMILIEGLLLDNNGNIPNDYKFFVFNGECRFVQVNIDRHDTGRKSVFTNDWDYLNLQYNYPSGGKIPKPENYNEMINISEKLGEDFNFVRVDLYNINGNIYFGELTHYPGSGMGKFTPTKYDFEFGSYWKINN